MVEADREETRPLRGHSLGESSEAMASIAEDLPFSPGDGGGARPRSSSAGGGGRPKLARRATDVDSQILKVGSSPFRALSRFRGGAPMTHRLPGRVMWTVTLLTASSMALINFCTIWVISSVVEWKFNTMQSIINAGDLKMGIFVFTGICMGMSLTCMALVFFLSPTAGSSGAPENKGWLNGNILPDFFTARNLVVRQMATMLANMSGYPVGREGPTVTMGSNLAFLITHRLALPYVRQWVDVDVEPGGGAAPDSASEDEHDVRGKVAYMIDEDALKHAQRIVCTVGGACGMAMLFDSPIGGIVYMFEEITSSSWPTEVTMRAFVGTTVCAVMSRVFLNLCGTTTKAFVVYEFHPVPDSWSWMDLPFFILLSAGLGAFSAFHTRACLATGVVRQRFIGSFRKSRQQTAKIVEAVAFIAACALTYALVALQAKCFDLPAEDTVEFVRYNCPEGQYNPVASLLLTTSEGAVKRLFSCKNANELHLGNECLAFVAYSFFNICLTGVPVPSGNFTGSMLIGGLAGRIVGAAIRHLGLPLAASGIYAMIGSAAMLSGFKQMCVAVIVFISGCANDLNLVPPMMVSVTVALLLNREINERGFDEEQILRKKIPFLPPDPPKALDLAVAGDLADIVPRGATLAPEMSVGDLKEVLKDEALVSVTAFPVVKEVFKDFQVCIGFTTRDRLWAAVEAAGHSPTSHSRTAAKSDHEEMIRLISRQWIKSLSAQSDEAAYSISDVGTDDTLLPVARLADRAPYTLLEDMPAGRAYAVFAKMGATAASLVSELGEYRGVISKAGLISLVREVEEDPSKLQRRRFSGHRAGGAAPPATAAAVAAALAHASPTAGGMAVQPL